MLRRRMRASRNEIPELNITAFLNLMVILIPFLLATAVFSRDAILEMNLAKSDGSASSQNKEWQLLVTIRQSGIDVGDSIGGHLQHFDYKGKDLPIGELNEFLQQIKAQKPEKTKATLLLEPNVSYATIVSIMDAVRLYEQRDTDSNKILQVELFPDVSLSDASLRGTK